MGKGGEEWCGGFARGPAPSHTLEGVTYQRDTHS